MPEVGNQDEWGNKGGATDVAQITGILGASNNQIPSTDEKCKAPCGYELYVL